MKESASRPAPLDKPQPDQADHDFERIYSKHDGAELVKLVLSITDRIVRVVRTKGAARHPSPENEMAVASPQEKAVQGALPAVRGGTSTNDTPPGIPDPGVLSASEPSNPRLRPEKGISVIALAGLLLVPLLGMGEATGEEMEQAIPGEPDIPILLEVVSCASDLLHCRDINTQGMAFAKMSSCDDELNAVEARAKRGAAPGTVIFARCRYSPAPARKAPPLAAVLRIHPEAGTTEEAVAAHPR